MKIAGQVVGAVTVLPNRGTNARRNAGNGTRRRMGQLRRWRGEADRASVALQARPVRRRSRSKREQRSNGYVKAHPRNNQPWCYAAAAPQRANCRNIAGVAVGKANGGGRCRWYTLPAVKKWRRAQRAATRHGAARRPGVCWRHHEPAAARYVCAERHGYRSCAQRAGVKPLVARLAVWGG